MEKQQTTPIQPPQTKFAPRLVIILVCLLFIIIFCYIFFAQKSQQLSTNIPTATAIPSEVPSPTATHAAIQNNWKVFNPSNHTFAATDNSFTFIYPANWSYETIDGIIPQQQHIVQLGPALSQSARQTLAQKAGIELNDSRGSISFIDTVVTLYYTNTPDFQVKKLEDLATGTILSKKQITIAKAIPALEVKVDCPTECVEIIFIKENQTFTFILAKAKADSKPLDTSPLTQIKSSFTFLE